MCVTFDVLKSVVFLTSHFGALCFGHMCPHPNRVQLREQLKPADHSPRTRIYVHHLWVWVTSSGRRISLASILMLFQQMEESTVQTKPPPNDWWFFMSELEYRYVYIQTYMFLTAAVCIVKMASTWTNPIYYSSIILYPHHATQPRWCVITSHTICLKYSTWITRTYIDAYACVRTPCALILAHSTKAV